MDTLSMSLKSYLLTIYSLSQNNPAVYLTDVAATHYVSKASACHAATKLEHSGLIARDNRHHICLTKIGQEYAAQLANATSLLQLFFTTTLNLSPAIATKEAQKMVCVLNTDTITKLQQCHSLAFG